MDEDCTNTCPPKQSRRPQSRLEKRDRSAYMKEYYEKNKEAKLEYYKQYRKENTYTRNRTTCCKRYNISEEMYDKLRSIKECSICGATEKLMIDHDHTSGIVRGVICHNCNVGLGHFKDSIELLDKAKGYLSWTTIKNT